MQPSSPLIAIGIGALVALSPTGSALSQSSEPSDVSPNTDAAVKHTPKSSPAQMATLTPNVEAERPSLPWVAVDRFEPVVSPVNLFGSNKSEIRKQTELPSEEGDAEVAEPTVTDDPPEAIAPPERLEEPGSTDPIVPDAVSDDTAPVEIEPGVAAPEYLEPDPNPLLFPTQREEVGVTGTQPITLEQALELARRNNRELQVTEQELERTRASLRESRSALYPTLDASAGATINESQGNATQSILSQLLGQPEPEQDDADFGVQGQLQLNYDLYTSGRRSALIRAAEQQVRVQELQLEASLEQLRLDVTNDYYDLQESDEQVRISAATLEESERSLRDAQALERAGVGTRFDVLQAEVDVANARQQLTQDISAQLTARRQLVQQLSLSETVDVSAADPVEVADRWELSLEDSILLAYRNRAELEQQLAQRESSEQQRRAELAALGPQISLFANYSLSDTLNASQEVSDQYQLGAQVQWRLLDGGAARSRAAQQEANITIAETQFADTRNQIRFQVEEAYLSLQANFDNIQTAALALQQATESLRLARLRFQAGVGTQSDVLRSQTELTRAEQNQLRAILGYNRSLVALERAVSNLDGELTDRP
jgi:outer membrane protein TolC